MSRLSKEEKLAKLEAELAGHKRKLRMETVPGVKEAFVIAKAIRKWQQEHGETFDLDISETALALEEVVNVNV